MQDFQTWLSQQQQPQPMLAEDDPNYAGQQVFLTQCASCHQINGLEVNGEPLEVEGNAAVESRHAPNLTYLMTRGVFAGALFDLWTTDEDGRPVPNRSVLEAWIRDPAEQKPMYDVPADPDALPRGMPDRGLSETDIDAVVDYLLTLHPPDQDGPPIQTAGADD
jgi:mono/diheme cytochrome c family protein